jgi:hypothetical protein
MFAERNLKLVQPVELHHCGNLECGAIAPTHLLLHILVEAEGVEPF